MFLKGKIYVTPRKVHRQGTAPGLQAKADSMYSPVTKPHAVFPRLDALHFLDASTRFDAGWSGCNTF